MSYEASFDKSGEAGVLANAEGWQHFWVWLESIPVERCSTLEHLVAYGWAPDLDLMADQVEGLLTNPPDPAIRSILGALSGMLVGLSGEDTVITVSDGTE